jgi:hypothetical protein
MLGHILGQLQPDPHATIIAGIRVELYFHPAAPSPYCQFLQVIPPARADVIWDGIPIQTPVIPAKSLP